MKIWLKCPVLSRKPLVTLLPHHEYICGAYYTSCMYTHSMYQGQGSGSWNLYCRFFSKTFAMSQILTKRTMFFFIGPTWWSVVLIISIILSPQSLCNQVGQKTPMAHSPPSTLDRVSIAFLSTGLGNGSTGRQRQWDKNWGDECPRGPKPSVSKIILE